MTPVVTADGVGAGTVLDGFALVLGMGYYGGGVYCTDSSLTIANNTIIEACAWYAGGGIYISGDNDGSGPIVHQNILRGCSTGGQGGAIYCEDSSASISDNTITPTQSGTPAPCLADGYGGGIYVTGGSPAITRNMILGSEAGTAGGGIYCDSSSARIADNVIRDNTAASGNGGGVYLTESDDADVVNNTITGNTASSGGGVYVADGSPDLFNNIVVRNSDGIWWAEAASPVISHNDVWGNTNDSNYPLDEDRTGENGNVSVDPVFQSDGFHISGISPCVAAGDNDAALPEDLDIDGQKRIQPALGVIDVGADEVEIADESCEHIALYPDKVPVRVGSDDEVVFTVGVYDSLTHAPVVGRDVCFAITSGEVVSISPNGHTEDTPPWGITGVDGKVTVTVSPDTSVVTTIALTAFATSECDDEMSCQSSIPIYSAVGFAYDLCDWRVQGYMDEYFERIAARYPDAATYDRVDLSSSLSDYNVIFVAMPVDTLTTLQLEALGDALSDFVNSGRQKRVILVGEYINEEGWWSGWNARLNVVADGLDMTCAFHTEWGPYVYDSNPNTLCRVEPNHYLMEGVVNLWDAETDTFASLGSAVPVAYINYFDNLQPPSPKPWILVEDTQSQGSRVAIHDSTLFHQMYNDTHDIDLNKNFRFVYNLCTKFP